MPTTTQAAPKFSGLNQNEDRIQLADYRGQWLILYFYPKDDTPGCTKEACGFTEILSELQQLNAAVLGVSPDSPAKHRKFREKHQLTIDLLADENKQCLRAYDAWGIKKNYGREYEGVIRSTFIIDPKGHIQASWRNVRVNGHIDKVLEKLKELQTA